MGFINDEKGYPVGNWRQHLCTEALVGQPLGRYKQDIHLIMINGIFNLLPSIFIVRIDSLSTNPHSFRRGDLVAHKR